MLASVRLRQEADRAHSSPREELLAYLNGPLEQVVDVVGWWGVCLLVILPCRIIANALFWLSSIILRNILPLLAWLVITWPFKVLLHLLSARSPVVG